jgi:hypothetical protein
MLCQPVGEVPVGTAVEWFEKENLQAHGEKSLANPPVSFNPRKTGGVSGVPLVILEKIG